MKLKLTNSTVKTLKPGDTPYEVRCTEIKGLLLRIQPSGQMSYFYDYRGQDGRRNRFRIGCASAISAVVARETVIKELAPQLAKGVDLQTQKKEQRAEAERAKARTLKGFLEQRYEPWALSHRKDGAATLARIRAQFEDLLPEPMADIHVWRIERWRADQRKAGKAPATINRDLIALRACLSKAVEWGVLDVHPLARLKPLKVDHKGKVRYLSVDEENRLLDALDAREARMRSERASANAWRAQRDYPQLPGLDGVYADHLKPLVLLALNTGLRRGELFALAWEYVDLDHGQLTVAGENAKSGRTRHIPLNSAVSEILRLWYEQGVGKGLVFPSADGERLDNVNTSWHGVLAAAGIQNFRFHDLRHSFASKLVMAGADLYVVKELLGHHSIAMTERYAHLAPEHKAAAVALLVHKE